MSFQPNLDVLLQLLKFNFVALVTKVFVSQFNRDSQPAGRMRSADVFCVAPVYFS
jgi:hypothetical protein